MKEEETDPKEKSEPEEKKDIGNPAKEYEETLSRGVQPADPWNTNTNEENAAAERALEKLADEKHEEEKDK
jgi:hypothetical protein